MSNNKGFTLVELITIIVILAILVSITISCIFSYINLSKRNVDINNAAALNAALNTLSTKQEVIWWASQSDETHILTWSYCVDGLSSHGFNAKYFIPEDADTKFNNYSWAYLIQKYITFSNNIVSTDYEGDGFKVLPESKTGDGFLLVITRDGKGCAGFHTYALCDCTESDLSDIKSRYKVTDKEWSWLEIEVND